MLFSLYSPSPVKMTRLKKLTLLALAACALALVVAACGGDDSEAGQETAPPTEPAPPDPPSDPPAPEPDPTPPEPSDTTTDPGVEPEPPPSEVAIAPGDVPTPTEVPAGAIAVVGEGVIEQARFDQLIGQREQTTVNQGGEFPAVGTVEYETVKNQLVDFLVQREQFTQEAIALGVDVTDEDVRARLDELKEQFFEDDEARYLEELEEQGLTEEQVLSDLRFQQITDELFALVTGEIEITDEEISTYYTENQESFTSPEQREVAHILVETKEEADTVYEQAEAGEDFATLAEENSIDEGTAVNGGAYTAVKGLSVPEFDEVAYALETDAISEPVETQFGWHVIKALEDIQPSALQPLDEVRDQIEGLIRSEQESTVVDEWLTALEAKYEGKVLYAVGFEPPPTDEPVDEDPSIEEAPPAEEAPEEAPAEESTP